MTYCINSFQGLIPRLDAAALPGNAARKAENVKLVHGRIDAWCKPRFVADLGVAQSAFVHDCCWAGAESYCKHFITARVCNDVYISDPCDCPKVVKDWCGDGEAVYLGLPKPDTPNATQLNGIADESCAQLRTYVVTYSGPCGEGAASAPSNAVKGDKDTEVQIQLPEPDPKYEVDKINVYVSHSMWDVTQGHQTMQQADINAGYPSVSGSDVEWFLVACVDVGTATVVDSGGDATGRLCRAITSEDFYPPPEGLIITGETSAGSLVGFIPGEQRIYYSERNAHYAWPPRKCKMVECRVRWVCTVGNRVVVLTDGNIYVGADDAEGTVDGSMASSFERLEGAYPLVSTRSVVCSRTGVVFASNNGLIRVTPDGAVDNISTTHFAPDDWWQIDPSSIRAAHYQGSYFFTSSRFSGIFDLNLEGHTAATPQNLTSICYFPICWIEDKQGRLFFVSDGKVYQWDASNELLPYTYVSAISRLPKATTFTAARVEYSNLCPGQSGDKELFRIESGCRERFCRTLQHAEPFRVNIQRARDLSVTVQGTRSIREICVGIDMPVLGIAA